MKNNLIRVSYILITISALILVLTLLSCAMLGLSSAIQVQRLFLDAEALDNFGDYDEAIEKYKVALEEFGKPGVTLGTRPLIDAGFPALVNSRIAGCYAKRVEVLFLAAERSHHSIRYKAAIERYKAALEEFQKPGVVLGFRPHIDENFPTLVNYRIAVIYSKLAEHADNSKEFYNKAIAYAERAALSLTNDKHTASFEAKPQTYKNHVVSSKKYEAQSYQLWGTLLYKTGELELAVEKFRELVKHFPESPFVEDALYYAAYCLFQLGRHDEALSWYTTSTTQYPKSQYIAALPQYTFSIGKLYSEKEQYKEALTTYQSALQGTEKQSLKTEIQSAIAETHLAIGKVYFQKKDHEKALSTYQLALQNTEKQSLKTEIQSAIAETHLAIGKVYFQKKDHEKALSTYQLALQNTEKQSLKTEIQSAIAETHLDIGKEYFRNKDYEKALSTYQLALQNTEKQSLKTEIQSAIAETHLDIGKEHFRNKDYEKALSTYQLALQNTEKQSLKTEIQSAIADGHLAIGKVYFQKKDYRGALLSYQLALQNAAKQPRRGEIWLAMTFAYFNRGDPKNAMNACKRVLSGSKISRERLTIAEGIQFYLEAENATFLAGYKGAVRKYNAALTEIQRNISTTVASEYKADLNYILGDILYKVERFESAEQQLTKVIDDFPDSNFVDDAWYAIGDMNYKLQSYLECRRAFRKILENFPNSDLRDDAQYFIAKSLLEELSYEKAYLAFDELTTKVFQIYPGFQDDAKYHAAYCLNLLGRDDMAIRRYENFLEYYPKSPYRVDAYFDLGTIYARQQNYESARSNYALAMQHTDDQALLSEIQMAIGQAYYNQEDYENTIVAHTSLLEKYPESDFIIAAKLGIANSHFRMRTWQEAADAYERVINEHPEATKFTPYCAYQVGEAHYGLATHHSEQDKTELAVKNFHKALEWYQKIIDDFPTEDSNNLGEIIELLITSLTRMRNDSSVSEELQSLAQLKKGDSYLATEQYGKALAEYNTFVQMFPNSTRGSSVQDRIKQVQEAIISKNLRQEKVRTTVEVPIEQQIAQKALASTVLILTTDTTGDPMALGSGFFISDNQIVSNWHVVEGATTAYALSVDEKTRYKIEGIIAMNPKQDLVILKVSGEGSPLPLGDNNIARIGESIYVTGNPKGWTGTFSIGVISSFQMRYAGKRIQITAPISPGSSGGPVLNDKGEVIGIVYAGHGGPDAQNLNLAIPVNYLKALLKRLGPSIPLSIK